MIARYYDTTRDIVIDRNYDKTRVLEIMIKGALRLLEIMIQGTM